MNKDKEEITITSVSYKLKHTIKETEKEYIITAKITIDKDKNGEKMIEKMFEKQESPIVTILKKTERDRKNDMKTGKYEAPLYGYLLKEEEK